MDELSTAEQVERLLIDAEGLVKSYASRVGEVSDDDWLLQYVGLLLDIADRALMEAEETIRAAGEPMALQTVFMVERCGETSKNLSALRTTLEGVAYDRVKASDRDVELPDGRVVYATHKTARKRTDGARILGLLAGRAADEFVPGEPPASFAHRVAQKIDRCAGLSNASQSWRKGELRKEGIALEGFVESERGAKTVRFTEAAPERVVPSSGRGGLRLASGDEAI